MYSTYILLPLIVSTCHSLTKAACASGQLEYSSGGYRNVREYSAKSLNSTNPHSSTEKHGGGVDNNQEEVERKKAAKNEPFPALFPVFVPERKHLEQSEKRRDEILSYSALFDDGRKNRSGYPVNTLAGVQTSSSPPPHRLRSLFQPAHLSAQLHSSNHSEDPTTEAISASSSAINVRAVETTGSEDGNTNRQHRQIADRGTIVAHPGNQVQEVGGGGARKRVSEEIPGGNYAQMFRVRIGDSAILSASNDGRVALESRSGQAASYAIHSSAYTRDHQGPGVPTAEFESHPRYLFMYGVRDYQTGDQKHQWEERNGDKVKGIYSLREPDGTLRTVEYTSDDTRGFQAMVKKSGISFGG